MNIALVSTIIKCKGIRICKVTCLYLQFHANITKFNTFNELRDFTQNNFSEN